jgi:SulP family sulfate permease
MTRLGLSAPAGWLRHYRGEWFRPDLLAGLPVEVGLYTALVPMVIYALLGSSRPLSVSTTTTLAILVGAILLLVALLRLGFVANFISESVLVGFKSGIGLVIVADRCPSCWGSPSKRSASSVIWRVWPPSWGTPPPSPWLWHCCCWACCWA